MKEKSSFKFKVLALVAVQAVVLSASTFAASSNSWIDLPVVAAIEYFSGMMATALKWCEKYAKGFGCVGLIWTGIQVMLNRKKPMQAMWDTMFKWTAFVVLVWTWPSLTFGFSQIGHQLGTKAGAGKTTIIESMKKLRDAIRADMAENAKLTEDMKQEIKSKCHGLTIDVKFDNCDDYDDFLSKAQEEIYSFNSAGDRIKATNILEKYVDQDQSSMAFEGQTLKALDAVLIQRDMNGNKTADMLDSYTDLDIYLRDANGNETPYISSGALLRMALLSCQIMFVKDEMTFQRALDYIDETSEKGITHVAENTMKTLGAYVARIPQKIMLLFSCAVLLLATAFAAIQYVMTVLEYTIVCSLAAIFLPLMLFDGTKDIPKKFIPVFINFLVKIMVMTACLMFVFWLMIQHAANTIGDDGGMNWVAVGEIVFESMLAYILTQNAPKVAQTIMTGQPQLSMAEALQGGGTTLATGVAMKQAPGAAMQAVARAGNKVNDIRGGIAKSNAAANYAKSQGEGLGGQIGARWAVASEGLKERFRAGMEAAGQKSGTGFSILDKGFQMAGLSGSGGGGGAGAGSSSSAYGQIGQGSTSEEYKGRFLSTTSNANYKTATKYDKKTGQQRHMTREEFFDEKANQGEQIARARERYNQTKAEQAQQGGTPNLDGMKGNRDSD